MTFADAILEGLEQREAETELLRFHIQVLREALKTVASRTMICSDVVQRALYATEPANG